ncbi:type II toxin-antitoxin system antitoxin DNA ADP-ribosyl glycohydrolase DarG [Aromatoleum evansii]|uniref:type II toxin-antitoxin system antitoxin DNA ADP-ribosyl glycohydrolase DarG n=1 Tax=Aromatoleum evansii TaxID=59406 RepID=UPI00145E8C0C|nr:macro domain-containing protein [Aromatoleum evansii]NMG32129.1 Appr-1-p processing protein [Aromatoleum evansii]
MITFTQGNLLEARAEALVNTVNTVGVMGKGIALMFKERFAENFRLYAAACKAKQVQTGRVFVTEVSELDGPRWIVNFPTKQHWRAPSRMEWIVEGLQDLRRFLVENKVKSVAIPPLGAGNGGLEWSDVRQQIEAVLADLETEVLVFEPTKQYQNVAKRTGVEKLTPARALIAELVRRYWVLGMECSLLEIQKLAWFLERAIEKAGLRPLDLRFAPNKYGPYADRLRHLLEGLDGSYLHCEKRISDADPLDVIWFDDERKAFVQAYLKSEARDYTHALEATAALIDGFESPFGMELLATVDWLVTREGVAPTVPALREGLRHWRGGPDAAARKDRLFDDKALGIALERLTQHAPAFA